MRGRGRWLAVALALAGAAVGRAQSRIDEQIRATTRDEVQAIETRARDAAEKQGFFFGLGKTRPGTKAGGWASETYVSYDEIDHDRRSRDPLDSLLLSDQRAWVSHQFDAERSLYFRLRKLNFDFHLGPGGPLLDTRTQEMLDLDIGTYRFPAGQFEVQAGRQFFLLGQGLVLAQPLDGAIVESRFTNGWDLTMLAGTSLHRTQNFDLRVAGYERGHDDRDYLGAQVGYTTKRRRLRYYAFGLRQHDGTRSEDPAQNAVDFHYQSHHFGVGTEGLLHKRLHYVAEHIREGGEDAGFDGRADIHAYATTVAAAYRFPGEHQPVATLDYALGSGDPNRLSVLGSLDLGPSAAAGDTNFLYFGQYEGGVALAPRLSNLRVWRLGMRGRPFPKTLSWPSDMVAGFKVSTYHKNRAEGTISDPLASQPFTDVGAALDLFSSWRIFSDLSLLCEYGTFKPGRAYVDGARDLTNRFAMTATASF